MQSIYFCKHHQFYILYYILHLLLTLKEAHFKRKLLFFYVQQKIRPPEEPHIYVCFVIEYAFPVGHLFVNILTHAYTHTEVVLSCLYA